MLLSQINELKKLIARYQSSNSMQAYKEAEKVVKGIVDGSVRAGIGM